METEVGMTRVWCGDRDIRGIYPLPWGVRRIEGQGWAEAGLLVTFLLLQPPQSRVLCSGSPQLGPVWWLAAGGGPRWPEDIASKYRAATAASPIKCLPPGSRSEERPPPPRPTSGPAENVAAGNEGFVFLFCLWQPHPHRPQSPALPAPAFWVQMS